MGSRKKVDFSNDEEQIDELLQAAQDELNLKLNIDSHLSRVSPNYLDSDLDRRFQALRSGRNPPPPPIENLSVHGEESSSVFGDDLAVRFAALKASLPSSASPLPSSITNDVDDEDGDEDDEVEKLIQWAKDSARLDPSPPSDDDEDDSSDEDDDDRRNERRKKKE